MTHPIDQTAQKVIQDYALGILQFLLPGLTRIHLWSGEVPVTKWEMDTVFTAWFFGKEVFVHIEIQLRGDHTMGERMFGYGSRLSSSYKYRSVISIVIWLERHGSIPDSPYRLTAGPYELATWKFQNVKVFEMTKDQITQGGIGMLLLAPFAEAVQYEDLEEILTRIHQQSDPKQLRECEALFLVAAER